MFVKSRSCLGILTLIVAANAMPVANVAVASEPSRNTTLKVYDAAANCPRKLVNNDLLDPPLVVPKIGHQIVIHNGHRASAIVKVLYPGGGRELRFVQAGGTARSLTFSDGWVRVQYAIGGRLAADCQTVINPESVGEFPPEDLRIRQTAGGYETSVVEYTLYEVRDGNVQPKEIDVAKFNAD